MTSGDDEDGQRDAAASSVPAAIIDMTGRVRGDAWMPHSVAIALPPHLAFLIHRDSARDGAAFAKRLNRMVIEYLEAYYEDDLMALDDEQLKLFGLGHLDVAGGPKSD